MANLNVSDYSGNRKHIYANGNNGYAVPGAYQQQTSSQASTLRAAPYMSTGGQIVQNGHPDAGNIAMLAQSFGGLNMNTNYADSRGSSSQIPHVGTEYAVNGFGGQSGMFVTQQPMMYMPASTSQTGGSMYPAVPSHMQPISGYGGSTDNSPSPHGQSYAQHIPSDGSSGPGMPNLITPRRGSISSNEEHNPATPFTVLGAYNNNGFAVVDRSPYTQSGTPSPLQFMHSYVAPIQNKYSVAATTPMHIQMLVAQDPPMPRAIPAPSSPMKPLDRCLENKNGETNVYIRGLLPETTDEMLHVWGIRFGDIQSSKSIIDLKTGLCKG